MNFDAVSFRGRADSCLPTRRLKRIARERPFTFTVSVKKPLFPELDLSQTEMANEAAFFFPVFSPLGRFLSSYPFYLGCRSAKFQLEHRVAPRTLSHRAKVCSYGPESRADPPGNPIRNINWRVLVSQITLSRTRVTWKLDGREVESR